MPDVQADESVVLWTSVATGKRMEKHGIVDWQLLSEDGQRKVLASGHSRRTEALWNIATNGGKSVQILNWWATWPAEEVAGEIVSNHFPRALREEVADVTFPPELARELDELALPGREDANRALAAAACRCSHASARTVPSCRRRISGLGFRLPPVFSTTT